MARRPPQDDDLFAEAVRDDLSRTGPLPARMRPRTLDDVVGHRAVLGPDGFVRGAIEADRMPSTVLYGPPGSGKTSLARVVAGATKAVFEELSATNASLTDVRAALQRARDRRAAGTRTVLFIDEIHRFNKAQQDALLPAVEDGLVTLIGATTENPYYEVNSALISRMRVAVLEPLSEADVAEMLDRAVADERGLAGRVSLPAAARDAIVARANGDGRAALNLLEAAAAATAQGEAVTAEAVTEAAGSRAIAYDRAGDAHYDTISAFIKSMRASDPDAALYYLAVMIAGGEDPKFIARRIIVAASEDVGNADPTALIVATAAGRAVEFVGLPEARINLAQATVYVALAPKSNAAYRGIDAALAHVERHGAKRPPPALRDASRANAKHLGHGRGYVNPHSSPDGVLDQSLLPEELEGERFYDPPGRGREATLWNRIRALRGDAGPTAGPEGPLPF
ncbi:MAG: replication-associated recombination protein A [Thermoleophilia bacterium]|nr:replication-associated recombination protein A [Thermoleophilia bacterium]